MRRILLGSFVVTAGWIAVASVGPKAQAQTPQEEQAKLLERARKVLQEPPSPLVPGSPRHGIVLPAPKLYELEDAFLRWPLPADGQKYGAIDGRHLHEYVDELVAISRHYRDQGHPLYWGRPIGSTADAESGAVDGGQVRDRRVVGRTHPGTAHSGPGVGRCSHGR
jgi:hypothetical protein